MSKYYIQSYKHDGSLHRTWSPVLVVEDNDEMFIAINKHTRIYESNNRSWIARDPALYYLYKKQYFNVIAMLRRDGIYYYCNLASPSIYDGEAIKNIDYDLDVKFYPDGSHIILDEKEFVSNNLKYKYPEVLENQLRDEIKNIISLHKSGQKPFNEEENRQLFRRYLNKL